MTPCTVACQPLLSREDRQEYWSGLPLPSPGDLPDPGIKPGSPELQADSLPSEPLKKHFFRTHISFKKGYGTKGHKLLYYFPILMFNILENERLCLGAYRNHVVSHLLKKTLLCINLLEKTLESPLDCKEIQPVYSKGDHPGISLEGMMLKLKLQYFVHLMRRIDSLEKTLMLGALWAGGKGDDRG